MVDRHGNLLYQVVCSWDFDHIILLVLLEQIENSICIFLECLAWPGQWQLDESQNIFCIECLCYLGLGLNCYLFIIVSLSLLYLLSVWRAEAEEVSNLLSGKLLTISKGLESNCCSRLSPLRWTKWRSRTFLAFINGGSLLIELLLSSTPDSFNGSLTLANCWELTFFCQEKYVT